MPFELTITEPVKIVCDTYEELLEWIKQIQNVIKPAKPVPVKAESPKPAVKEITRVVKPEKKTKKKFYPLRWLADEAISLIKQQECWTSHDIPAIARKLGRTPNDAQKNNLRMYVESLSEWDHNGVIIGCDVARIAPTNGFVYYTYTPFRYLNGKKLYATKHFKDSNPTKGGKPVFNPKDPSEHWDEKIEQA